MLTEELTTAAYWWEADGEVTTAVSHARFLLFRMDD
jgi:hypothetical protein